MGPKACTPLFRVVVHAGTVLGEHGAVDDHGRRPKRIQGLALERRDQRAFGGQADEVMRRSRLRW